MPRFASPSAPASLKRYAVWASSPFSARFRLCLPDNQKHAAPYDLSKQRLRSPRVCPVRPSRHALRDKINVLSDPSFATTQRSVAFFRTGVFRTRVFRHGRPR